MNKRRLRLAITTVLTVLALAYFASAYVPSYRAFGQDFKDKWFWTARGFDDPDVRRKAYESCMVSQRESSPGYSASEERQYDSLCSRPGWVIGDRVPSWWNTTVAFLESLGAKSAYVLGAIVFGPWLFAFLMVSVVPATLSGIWKWLRTSDDPTQGRKNR